MQEWEKKLANLTKEGLSILVENDNKPVFSSFEPMLKPLYICLTEKGAEMNGAVVYDKIVGKAAAFLCILGKVKAIYTPLASQSALDILEKYHIPLTTRKTIPLIMNRDGSDTCPMEKMAATCNTPEEFFALLQERVFKK